jgi:hypothetical protein
MSIHVASNITRYQYIVSSRIILLRIKGDCMADTEEPFLARTTVNLPTERSRAGAPDLNIPRDGKIGAAWGRRDGEFSRVGTQESEKG